MSATRKVNVITLFAVVLCAEAFGKTGDLWNITVKSFDASESSIEDVARFLEHQSRDVSGKGEGVRIIIPQTLVSAKQKTGMRFVDTSIETVLKSTCETMGLGYEKFYNTAVIGQPGERYIAYTVTGRCSDAVSKKPITVFSIRNEDAPWPCECTFVEDGRFFCACLIRFPFNVLDGVVFFDIDCFDRPLRLRISAAGYESKSIDMPIFGGESVCHEVEIQLQPNPPNSAASPTSHQAKPMKGE